MLLQCTGFETLSHYITLDVLELRNMPASTLFVINGMQYHIWFFFLNFYIVDLEKEKSHAYYFKM